MKAYTTRRRRGFTLIELLVVIAIIAILAAILFPVFGRTREKARQANCLSNLKQINVAMIQYCDDFSEYLPMCSWYFDKDGVEQVSTAIQKLGAYGCPWIIPDQEGGTGINSVFVCSSGRVRSSYCTLNHGQPYWAGGVLSRANCAYPSVVAMVGEAPLTISATTGIETPCNDGHWDLFFSPKRANRSPAYDSTPGTVLNPETAGHNGFNSIGYVDGHVKASNQGSMYANWGWWSWNAWL